ncbi:type II secretion system F family protein [Streptomyces niveus]|uniref:type II secretion system F family protein n=1 Tax=Streptomyces niveus TaxID=193462 RepID=UPI0036CBEA90
MSLSYLPFLGMLAGLLLVVGICGAVAALRGWGPRGSGRGGVRRRARRAVAELPAGWRANYRHLCAASAVLGVVVWAWTGWPMHGVVAGAALAGLPFVLHPGGSARAQIDRLDAVGEWLQQLVSVHGGGKPLEQTIRELSTVPPAVRREVNALARRLESGIPARQAYRGFADDMGNLIGDDITMLLLDHAATRGPGLARVLETKAASVAAKAAGLRDVDAERAKSRANARRVSLFVLAVVAVALANPAYTAPYGTGPGQGGLLLLGAGFAGALVWLRRMAQPRPEPRLLLTAAERETTAGERS